ncbi:recombinase family protein, partial [Xanthomonas hortorum]|uniref:recombinase family protein n=2 Tax=Xanthomonas hortorum TaxID=56454 RepID=UPI0032E877EA
MTEPIQPRVARIYQRISTDGQDLTRQAAIVQEAKAAGFYVAGVYREKASGARADRPELLRMIEDLQPGEVVIAEKIDRISRLPLVEAKRQVASIRAKGARLAVHGGVDFSEVAAGAKGVAKVVLESMQDQKAPGLQRKLIRPGFRRHSRPSLRVAPFKLYRGQV